MGSERDEFARVVAKMAVTQICESVGFSSFQASAIETLSDIAIRYLRDLAKAAHHNANTACRIESNAFDVITAIDDMGPAGSTAECQRSISRSIALREVMKFAEYGEEVPFNRPLPRFPVSRKRFTTPSFAQLHERPTYQHIPLWLPAFPDGHTFERSPVWPEKRRDSAACKVEQARQRRKGESSLVALHSRLAGSKPSQPLLLQQQQQQQHQEVAGEWDEREKKNPFLWPAVEGGTEEVKVTQILFGEFKEEDDRGNDGAISIAEAFAAVLESGAGEANGLELQEGTNSLAMVEPTAPRAPRAIPVSKNRPRVVLTFDIGAKLGSKGMYASKVLGVDKDAKRLKVGGVREEDKDERQRRAEQILAQSMEHVDA